MKKLLLTSLTLVSISPVFAGNMNSCNSISNSDNRNYCYAIASGESYHCNAIKNDDKKNYCLAVSMNQSYRCNSIHDSDMRAECKSNF